MATVNDRLRDEAIAHTLWISRYSTGVANRMVKLLNDSDAEITVRLLVAMDSLPGSQFTVNRLESLLGSVRELNHQAVAGMQSSLADELLQLAEHETGYQLSLFDSLLPQGVKTRFPLQGVTPDMVHAAAMAQPFQGRLLSEWADNLEADRMARITNTVRRGYLLGDATETIARQVRGHANKGYQDGALQMSRANAASITKTAVNHLAATARTSFAQANDDIVKGKQWLSTLDNKTTPLCIVRDRLRYTMDNKPIGHKVPYLQGPGRIHFCCRSTETLILKSWREMGIDADEMDEGSRASMDGQVPADTTYLEWLSRQSPQRQDQILGPERGRLYRAGHIQLRDMYTDKGEWISLAQLKALSTDNEAGKSPGFSLTDAQSVAEIEKGMRGIVAEKIRFPQGTSLEAARAAAGAMQDVITRFGLPPVSSFSEVLGARKSAAGAYYEENRAIHIARWALKADEWDAVRENGAGYDFESTLPLEKLLTISDAAAAAAEGVHFDYTVIPSVAGTITHEMGHHLYFQRLPEVEKITVDAYASGWWRPVSYYASENGRELFAEVLALFMLGGEDDHQRIYPELLAWLKKNSRS